MTGRTALHGRRSRLAWLPAILVAGACATEGGGTPGGVDIGRPAPAYATTDLRGDSVSLAAMRGRVVLLNVWATWCKPCRTEIPDLQALHERYAPRGLEVVGVSVDSDGTDDVIQRFMQDFRMTYPVWRDPAERVSTTFLLLGVPGTFLIDRDGVLRWRKLGAIEHGDTTLVRAIEAAL